MRSLRAAGPATIFTGSSGTDFYYASIDILTSRCQTRYVVVWYGTAVRSPRKRTPRNFEDANLEVAWR
jgi:hypothetical protein